MSSILITGGKVVTASGDMPQDVFLHEGKIAEITCTLPQNTEQIDATGLLIYPGLIDCHVHFREPGFLEKGTMHTEAASARAGGVTTVCDMPNTDPPTVTVAALADKVRRASEIQGVDIRFFFGVTEEAHLTTLKELFESSSEELIRLRARCVGLKLYLDHSTGDQKVSGGIIDDVFRVCSEIKIPIVAHCEDAEMNSASLTKNTRTDIAAHSEIRSVESEKKAIDFALSKAKKYGTHLHVAHLSTAPGLALIAQAKTDGLSVSTEVAPHHLFLSTEDYDALGPLVKMNPPLRSKEHTEALMQGLIDRTVDCVATDHAPHTLTEKQSGDPLRAPSGVPGVETMLPLLLTAASGMSPHPHGEVIQGLTHATILDACFTRPNEIFGLGKSGIATGSKTDLVLVDPNTEWRAQGSSLHAKCGWTPYEGWSLKGKVTRVL